MVTRKLIGQRLIAAFALGWLLFNFPLLAIFNDAGTWFGIPRLYAYLFIAWALFIALLAFIVERRSAAQTAAPAASSATAPKD